ncbi:T3SS effector HopA1 family protein [Streptomyces sp. CRN 30]|uniref:T3SS effector HopA1 family protein n=1 Tax=Streptomyces sp. CRN 30 TaxID=3075613 RepID=UPI002A83D04B|nr:T3SS effector HopA1 family protein [Streptomyces sp. CRN 30]
MPTTAAAPPLSPALQDALATVELHPGDSGGTPAVTVAGHRVEAATPRELRVALGNVLYEQWHAGIRDAGDGPVRGPRRDTALEERLAAQVPHTTTRADAVLRRPATDSTPAVVELGRVLVSVPADAVHAVPGTGPGPGPGPGPNLGLSLGPGDPVQVEHPALRPALSPGFLLVDGAQGFARHVGRQEVLRLYVHVAEAAAAPAVWGALLRELAGLAVPYRAKVLSRSWSYPRRDAVVVYLCAEHAAVASRLAAALAHTAGIADDVSVFAHRLAPGTAVAWDPRDPRPARTERSFGQHRAAAVADGVVRHLTGPDDDTGLAARVAAALREASVLPAEPARNTTSPAFTATPPAREV